MKRLMWLLDGLDETQIQRWMTRTIWAVAAGVVILFAMIENARPATLTVILDTWSMTTDSSGNVTISGSSGIPVCALTAAPTQIKPGEATKLNMQCAPAVLTYDLVSGQTCDAVLSCPWFKPTSTTTYQMVGVSAAGVRSNTASVTVTVGSTPPPASGCGPGEVFGSGDVFWTPLYPNSIFPNYYVEANGDSGASIKFLADSRSYSKGLLIEVNDQKATASTKEAVISSCPHSFTPVNNQATCTSRGSFGSYSSFRTRFGTADTGGDCLLDANQTYYINFRSGDIPREGVSTQFNAVMRWN